MLTALMVIFFVLWIVVICYAGTEKGKKDAADWAIFAGLLCLLLGTFTFGRLLVRNDAGKPIGEFHNGDVYKVVFFSPITDDSRIVVMGLRKLDDGRAKGLGGLFCPAERNADLALRVYRVPTILVEPIRSYHPPFEIEVFQTGDAVSFSYHTPEKTHN